MFKRWSKLLLVLSTPSFILVIDKTSKNAYQTDPPFFTPLTICSKKPFCAQVDQVGHRKYIKQL